eukprot:1156328-Pelagomonas_calceolata.AAC.13
MAGMVPGTQQAKALAYMLMGATEQGLLQDSYPSDCTSLHQTSMCYHAHAHCLPTRTGFKSRKCKRYGIYVCHQPTVFFCKKSKQSNCLTHSGKGTASNKGAASNMALLRMSHRFCVHAIPASQALACPSTSSRCDATRKESKLVRNIVPSIRDATHTHMRKAPPHGANARPVIPAEPPLPGRGVRKRIKTHSDVRNHVITHTDQKLQATHQQSLLPGCGVKTHTNDRNCTKRLFLMTRNYKKTHQQSLLPRCDVREGREQGLLQVGKKPEGERP